MATNRPTQQEVADRTADQEEVMLPQSVPINMYEASGALVIVAPLPAVRADDVTIELRPDELRFWAHLRSEGPRDHIVQEWHYGGYERTVQIPEGFGSGIEASLANGQLILRVLRGPCVEEITIQPHTH